MNLFYIKLYYLNKLTDYIQKNIITIITCRYFKKCKSINLLQLLHKSRDLHESEIKTLASLTNVDHMNEVLDNICVVRVVGTSAHSRVGQVQYHQLIFLLCIKLKNN